MSLDTAVDLAYHRARTHGISDLHDKIGPFRVMTVAEGWAMCRRKGAMPFVRPWRDVLELIVEASDGD